jgi:hypothetical protein
MHAWDEPAETLLALGPKRGARLVMPRLGEPVEPSHVDRVSPWWRSVERRTAREPVAGPREQKTPGRIPWPMD